MTIGVKALTRVDLAITSSIICLTVHSIFLVDLEEGCIDSQTIFSLSQLLLSGFFRFIITFNAFEIHLIIDVIFSIFIFASQSAEEGVGLTWA